MRCIEYLSSLIVEQPGALSQIIQDETGFHIYPGNTDITLSAMDPDPNIVLPHPLCKGKRLPVAKSPLDTSSVTQSHIRDSAL